MRRREKQVLSTADTALDLADKAERGDACAAFELALMFHPSSVTDFVEFIAPTERVTVAGFDAIADGFFFARQASTRQEES